MKGIKAVLSALSTFGSMLFLEVVVLGFAFVFWLFLLVFSLSFWLLARVEG